MILPTKYITSEKALIGVGATILSCLSTPKTVSTLWYEIESRRNIGTFQNYILGLSFLKMINAIDYKNDSIVKVKSIAP